MGQGLGKNSPLVLSLGKENYEALIARHGQWVRWRVATKCPCVNIETMQSDIHCPKCGGLGFTYGIQKDLIVTQTVMQKDNSAVIQVNKEYEKASLLQVYDNAGNTYPRAIKKGTFVILNWEGKDNKGIYITCVMKTSVIKTLKKAVCQKVGDFFYKIEELVISKNTVEGLYHSVNCDILSIAKIKDKDGREYSTKDFRQNGFFIEPQGCDTPIAEPITVENVEYTEPWTFVLLNQNLSKTDDKIMQELQGDAVLTFPYNCNVSCDDIITVLSGAVIKKSIMTRKAIDFDVIPSYFVESIIDCIGKDRVYKEGKDFVLVANNRIKWQTEDAPKDGEAYSITYNVLPTYKVLQAVPQIRTSENQRMPKKAIVKLYDIYGDARKIGMQ